MYETIKDVCLFASKYDKISKKAEKVLAWLDSPACPLVPKEEV